MADRQTARPQAAADKLCLRARVAAELCWGGLPRTREGVRNGDALWHAAEEYGKKIRRMDLAGNVEAAATRAEFLAQWPEIEDRKYEIDVDGGIEMAANLAGVSGQNMEEMFIP